MIEPQTRTPKRRMYRGARAQTRSGLANPAQWLIDTFTGDTVDSGVKVNCNTAMRATAVWACVRVLAEAVGSLPLHVYRRTDAGKDIERKHPLYPKLHSQPNPWQTSMEFREMMMIHLALRGNAVAEIIPGPSGSVEWLLPLHPDNIKMAVLGPEQITYTYRDPLLNFKERRLGRDEVLHIRGLSTDGYVGLSPIQECKQAVGLSIAAEKFGSKFFGNAARPSGILEHPGQLSEKEMRNLRESRQALMGGLDQAHKLAVLEQGMKWSQTSLSNEDSQFLDTRKFQLPDIARIWGVPPHLAGDMQFATFSNIEHQAISHVVHTLRPWFVRWEQAIQRDLLDDDNYFVEFSVDGLLRGDVKSRTAALQLQFLNGALTLDEWRAIENRNAIPDDMGETHFVPLNLQPLERATEEPEPVPAPLAGVLPPDDDESEEDEAVRMRFIWDIAMRLAKAEDRELAKRLPYANKDRVRFNEWALTFYTTRLADYAVAALEPLKIDATTVRDRCREIAERLSKVIRFGPENKAYRTETRAMLWRDWVCEILDYRNGRWLDKPAQKGSGKDEKMSS